MDKLYGGIDVTANLPSREEAWKLVAEWIESDALRKHLIGVEAVMRAYARKLGEDEHLWGLAGLLHDLDWERHPTPEEHPMVGVAHLESLGYPEAILEAIKGHAPYLGVERATPMAKALFAVDELVGFIVAVALVRPSKSLADVKLSSIKKKWKDKAFARGCDREEMAQAAAEFGVDLDEHIQFVLEAMQEAAAELGLA